MSISTNSTNSGDFLFDDYEMNYDEFSLVKEGAVVKTSGEQFTERQQMKELSEKFAKMELVLKNTKLELKNKGLQEKLKQQETNALLAKIEAENGKMKNEIEKMQEKMDEKEKQYMDKWEQLQKKEVLQEKCDAEEENRKMRNEEQKEMKEKLNKLEEKLEELQKKFVEMENEQKKSIEKPKVVNMEMGHQQQKVDEIKNVQQNELNVLEKEHKETKMKMALLNLGKNCWDANACHNELKITDDKCLAVIYEGKACGFRTVFATHPIWHGNNSSGLFYFEISIKDMPNCPYGLFGFAVKNLKKLEVALEFGTFGYLNHGNFIINGEGLYREAQKVESYEENDIVGCGVNWANRMIFFTKNGRRQGPFYLLANSPYFFPHQLFPFISLYAGDKIDANFGPNFKFNLATL